ncbi:hypothetical protein BY458DRAFT_497586 [Sporodiniella umbellata]|nr:hypothetical protein BY458DRAFT_497586 [Sporodiniella umbellata]
MYVNGWGSSFKRPSLQKVSPLVKVPTLMSLSPLSSLEDDEVSSSEEEETVSKSQTCPNLAQCLIEAPGQQARLQKATTPQQVGFMLSQKYQLAAENILKFQSSLQQRLKSSRHANHTKRQRQSLKIQTAGCLSPLSDRQARGTGQIHCRVMQMINTASDKSCDYTLSVYLNGERHAVQTGCLSKTEKNMSAARPQEEPMQLNGEGPFELTFQVAARYTPSRFQHGLAKLGWTRQPQGPLPTVGHAVLQCQAPLQNASVMRFKLIQVDRLACPIAIELVVDLRRVKELPASVIKFPWAYHLKQSALWTCQSLGNSTLLKDPALVLRSRQQCAAGDYLTLYTRGSAHPAWKRFWVTLDCDRLNLFDFTYKASKKPVGCLPLASLVSVAKPSMDDCENVGMARKVGIMLQFDPTRVSLSNPTACLDTESLPLEGKSFVYCDDESKAHHWRRALVAHTTTLITQEKGDKVSMDFRFLW